MPRSRPSLVVVCGGRSAERFVSLVSARCVIENVPPRFARRLVHIAPEGSWTELGPGRLSAESPEDLLSSPAARRRLLLGARPLDPWRLLSALSEQDCVFPVLHGPMGEDGTIQGMLEMAGAAYVGCGVLGSAAAMDKDAGKRLSAQAGIPQLPWAVARSLEEAQTAAGRLGWPVFIKPARMGSSIGVSKVSDAGEVKAAWREALRHDDKALVEKGIPAREIECAVLGDPWAETGALTLKASLCGEIEPNAEFYDYKAKYLDPNGAKLLAPAPIPASVAQRVRRTALTAFRALDLYGLARMDFFLHRRTGAVYFNEANTLPGFTPISMYPRLWRESGVPTSRLVETLIQLALRRAHRTKTRAGRNI